jgi:hypothetical protein
LRSGLQFVVATFLRTEFCGYWYLIVRYSV